jgi:hypothetical protein
MAAFWFSERQDKPTSAVQVRSGECPFRNMTCRWTFDPAATAMAWSPDIGQEIRSSGGFLIPHPAVVDPERSFSAS